MLPNRERDGEGREGESGSSLSETSPPVEEGVPLTPLELPSGHSLVPYWTSRDSKLVSPLSVKLKGVLFLLRGEEVRVWC